MTLTLGEWFEMEFSLCACYLRIGSRDVHVRWDEGKLEVA